MKHPYEKTTMPNVPERLLRTFGEERGADIARRACERMTDEIAKVDRGADQALRRHLTMGIIPCAACYLAMLDCGVGRDQALAFLRDLVTKNTEKAGLLMRRLCGWIPMPLFRRAVKMMILAGYPASGWTIEWQAGKRNEVAFHMSRCLYVTAFAKLQVSELCSIYCDADYAMFKPLKPKIRFIRQSTLTQGAPHCDFCFRRRA